jgi:hypothetical protein
MVSCPNCRADMAVMAVEANVTLHPIEVDVCGACCLLWFDQSESVLLAPRAVLALFQYIGSVTGGPRTPLSSSLRCPRCDCALAPIRDLQRNTRFTYWRCTRDRGQLITFDQFLREKNFIRTPSPAELNRLRDTIRQIACSQCGAPIDLATESACPHCGAPISMIDPDGVAKAVHDLASGPAATQAASPADTSARFSEAQANAILDLARMDEHRNDNDLIAIGLSAIGAVLAGLLAAR